MITTLAQRKSAINFFSDQNLGIILPTNRATFNSVQQRLISFGIHNYTLNPKIVDETERVDIMEHLIFFKNQPIYF